MLCIAHGAWRKAGTLCALRHALCKIPLFNLRSYVLSAILLFSGNFASAQVAVIVNKSVQADNISESELLDFYSRDVRLWDNGDPVIVFDLKPKSEVKDAFYKYLGKSTSRMKSIWMKKMLSGEGDPPEALETEEAVVKKVAATPGSVGFVSQSKVTENVKVLVVIETKEEN
jgi:ABC-type phosphate transport system substrate-binding protein